MSVAMDTILQIYVLECTVCTCIYVLPSADRARVNCATYVLLIHTVISRTCLKSQVAICLSSRTPRPTSVSCSTLHCASASAMQSCVCIHAVMIYTYVRSRHRREKVLHQAVYRVHCTCSQSINYSLYLLHSTLILLLLLAESPPFGWVPSLSIERVFFKC